MRAFKHYFGMIGLSTGWYVLGGIAEVEVRNIYIGLAGSLLAMFAGTMLTLAAFDDAANEIKRLKGEDAATSNTP